jgi:hypothetical protein
VSIYSENAAELLRKAAENLESRWPNRPTLEQRIEHARLQASIADRFVQLAAIDANLQPPPLPDRRRLYAEQDPYEPS